MIMLSWSRLSCRPLLFLVAVLVVESSQLDGTKVNSIKSTLMGETPTQATNRSTTFHQGLALGAGKKSKILGQGSKGLKHYHRQGERRLGMGTFRFRTFHSNNQRSLTFPLEDDLVAKLICLAHKKKDPLPSSFVNASGGVTDKSATQGLRRPGSNPDSVVVSHAELLTLKAMKASLTEVKIINIDTNG
ncbi:hypothetical protein JRQ81_016825 [Phrynocephalus forsythii]|uniref:Uncharacterized protein n=1 Tax=Phrynocephalus forsythii TaxID=171643 RepID=A0A9Q1B1H3_9SAUR|nr:hypothetical protein JRQ81_016825 [Phrynocephalus forsythii]